MKKPVISFVRDLKSNKKMQSLDEASAKQAVALRLLSLLGWDIFNVEEVYPDFSSDAFTVSYALRIDGISKLILDVKRPGENPDELHKQLVAFAGREGIELDAHTDGAGGSIWPRSRAAWPRSAAMSATFSSRSRRTWPRTSSRF